MSSLVGVCGVTVNATRRSWTPAAPGTVGDWKTGWTSPAGPRAEGRGGAASREAGSTRDQGLGGGARVGQAPRPRALASVRTGVGERARRARVPRDDVLRPGAARRVDPAARPARLGHTTPGPCTGREPG